MRLLFLFIFTCCFSSIFSQHLLTGKVIDGKNKAPLAFVNIITTDQKFGTSTDIDGKFTFNTPQPVQQLTLSYVGYEQTNIDVKGKTNVTIELSKTSYQIDEVKIFPSVNPAERIIKEVIKNRNKHNPEKSLDFKYESYNKLFYTFLMDSTEHYNAESQTPKDSVIEKGVRWLENHHVFMSESVTERKYKRPDKNYEKVIASKVSGIKNPNFGIIGTQLQSFSFYNSTITFLDKFYLNPITKNSINKYLFLIEDTVFNSLDTVYIISFRPRKGKNFDALKGLLYINTNGFAIQNVIAEPNIPPTIQYNEISMKIQQHYKKIEGSWFPIQLDATISQTFNDPLLKDFKLLGIIKTYLKNIQINPRLSTKEFSHISLEIDKDIAKKDTLFWKKYRKTPLSQKEKNTYQVIDSIGNALHFDRKLKVLEALTIGKIKWGYFDIDLNRFLYYNNYEGIRLGAGLHTNDRLFKWVSIGGYGGYGFKDKEFKYGGDIDFLIHAKNDIHLNLSIIKDVEEPGVVAFHDYKPLRASTAGFRKILYLNRMNKVNKIEARLKFRSLRYLTTYLSVNQETIEVTNNYFFKNQIENNIVLNDQYYTFSNINAEFRYAFKEKVIKTLTHQFPKISRYPIIYAKIEQGIKIFDGEYQYTRYTIKSEKKFLIKNWGQPTFYIEAGLTHRNVPQHKLNSSLGSYNPASAFSLSTENTFETMLPYEFFSDRYVNFHFRHNFGSLLLKTKKFQPEFVITSSIGFGSLLKQDLHSGEPFKSMEKGYYESGLIIKHAFLDNFSYGIAGFYRYGPYSLPNFNDNFAIKLTTGFVF